MRELTLNQWAQLIRVLRRLRARLTRKRDGLRNDLTRAQHAPIERRMAEALLVHLGEIPRHSKWVKFPDPARPEHTLEIELDPRLKPPLNAARYFKRAAKGERGLIDIPPRIEAVEVELLRLDQLVMRAEHKLENEGPAGEPNRAADAELARDVAQAIAKVPPAWQAKLPSELAAALRLPQPTAAGGGDAQARRRMRAPASRLMPRRLRSREGWEVLIGRNNEGNDYLTHRLARPEDYWFHVQGASGSHVVLRRGKGKNEPSKQTLAEVASWVAFYSKARSAGRVPVIVTRKKYVRKVRKAPPGLVRCERETLLMAAPAAPPKDALPRDE
jgi:predicted ribosome quality control (RQC) complex YloA/Tae2 family protein